MSRHHIHHISCFANAPPGHVHLFSAKQSMERSFIIRLAMYIFVFWACTDLSGVCAGMDTQQTAVLIAVMVGGGVVHPMMPNTDEEKQNQ